MSIKYKKSPKHIVLKMIIILAPLYYIIRLSKYPISIFYKVSLVLIIFQIVLFTPNIIGIIGVFSQSISQKKSLSFYQKAYKISHLAFFYPLSPSLLSTYSIELIRINKFEKAIEVIDEGIYISNYFVVSKNLKTNKALAMYKLNKIDEAIAIYREILQKFGKENQILLSDNFDIEKYINSENSKEKSEQSTEQYKLKSPSLKQIIEENPYFTTADFTTLAYLYIIKNDISQSIFFTKLAAKKDENYAAVYDNFGQIALLQNDEEKALKYFNKSLSLNPNFNDSLLYMAKIYIKKGEFEKAKEYFKQINKNEITGISTISLDEIKDLEKKIN